MPVCDTFFLGKLEKQLSKPPISVPWGCCDKVPGTGWLNTTETWFLTSSGRTGVRHEGVRGLGRVGGSVPGLFQLLGMIGDLRRSLAWRCVAVVSASVSVCVCVCVCACVFMCVHVYMRVRVCRNSSLQIGTPVPRSGPTLLQHDLIPP